MPDNNGFDIPITSSFSPEGTDAAAKGVQNLVQSGEQVESKFRDATHAADEFTEHLKQGVGIDVGRRLVEGLEEVVNKLREAISAGIEFDQEIENSTLGIAAALRSVEPEKYLNFGAAREQATANLDAIRAKANTLGVDFKSLEGAYSASLHALVEGGVTDIGQQLDLVSTLIAAASTKGVTGVRALIDTVDILNARGSRTVLAKELGLEDEALKAATKSGMLYAEIIGKIGGYQEGLNAQADTLTSIEQRTHNLIQQLEGTTTAPVFDALKDGLRELDTELAKPEVAEGLRAIGFEIAGIVHTGADFLSFCVQNAGALSVLAQGTAAWGAAVAAVKIKDLVLGLAAKVLRVREETATLAQDTAATEANTRAKVANAEANAAGGKTGGGAAAAGLGFGGALNVGLLAGTALAAVITEIAANIDAATKRENEFGAAIEKANKSLIEQVRNARTPADQKP